MALKLKGIHHVAVNVIDPRVAAQWLTEVLGLTHVHADAWDHNPAMMAAPDGTGVALSMHSTSRPHVAFAVEPEDFPAAQEHFRELGITFSYVNHGPTESIYVDTPHGYQLEFTSEKPPR